MTYREMMERIAEVGRILSDVILYEPGSLSGAGAAADGGDTVEEM